MDSKNGMQIISAHVPQSELFTYATELKSLTGGRGTFSSVLASPAAVLAWSWAYPVSAR